jgi:DNA-binding GntR family transcriptional regulator
MGIGVEAIIATLPPKPMPSTARKSPAPTEPPELAEPDDANVEERVYAAVSKALLSGKLRPGTPLRERALAEALGCTRGAVRKVLARLGSEKRLVLEHNRGAFVPNPSIADMRGIYRARRIVEAGLITTLFGQLAREQVAALRKHVQAEQKAFKEGRREDSIRLAGDFHLLLAQMAGSDELLLLHPAADLEHRAVQGPVRLGRGRELRAARARADHRGAHRQVAGQGHRDRRWNTSTNWSSA